MPRQPCPLPPTEEDRQRARAEALIAALAGADGRAVASEAGELVLALRNLRAYELMQRLAEALSRVAPDDARNRRLYAQCLIERGFATAAVDLLRALLAALPAGDPEAVEAWGLLGRAHKQVYFDAGDKASPAALHALAAAVDAYRQPYEAAPTTNTWHGVNLLALLSRARREGLADLAPEIDGAELAGQLLSALMATPVKARDEWFAPTLAEVTLGLSLASGDLQPVESQLRDYLRLPGLQAFQVASTLRQFTEVWGLDTLTVDTPGTGLADAAAVRRARGLVDILRARLMQLPGGGCVIPAEQAGPPPGAAAIGTMAQGAAEVQSVAADRGPDRSQLEAILGDTGAQTFAWWRAGIDAARSVAVIRQRLGKRLGTGFLVRAGDFGLVPPDERLLLTNFHVVNPLGASPGIRPDQAEAVFEADDPRNAYAVAEVMWSSPVEQHDASLLRLAALPAALPALPLSAELPPVPAPAGAPAPRVYIVGYPGGRELSFSFQDNELLDHEGPPTGQPQIPGVCRVHYRAPTEGGNSGSPVFNAAAWQVVALHHKGGRFGMPRLNGQSGTYAANEGLAMATLVAAVKAPAT